MSKNFISGARQTFLGLSLLLLGVATQAEANLIPMNNDDLSSVDGQQVGLLIGLEMRINQTDAGTDTAGVSICTGANLVYCRLGLQFNNVSDWLLLKGFQGYINIPQILLYGTATNAAGFTGGPATPQSMIAISLAFPNPTNSPVGQEGTAIKIRNLSYTLGLATPVDSSSNPIAFSNLKAIDNQNAYYNYSTYSSGDETGFLKVTMNGNLNVGGTLYVYAK